jgi:hypothetical protein
VIEHTPGPWRIDKWEALRGQENRQVVEYGSGVIYATLADLVSAGNAKLRNAAPEMYELLYAIAKGEAGAKEAKKLLEMIER